MNNWYDLQKNVASKEKHHLSKLDLIFYAKHNQFPYVFNLYFDNQIYILHELIFYFCQYVYELKATNFIHSLQILLLLVKFFVLIESHQIWIMFF